MLPHRNRRWTAPCQPADRPDAVQRGNDIGNSRQRFQGIIHKPLNNTLREISKGTSRVDGRAGAKRENPGMPSALPHPQSRSEIARRIRVIRAAMDLDPTTFAARCLISRQAVSNYEQTNPAKGRRPNVDEALKIVAATGFGLNFIYRGDITDVPSIYAETVARLMNAPPEAETPAKRRRRKRSIA